jgi:acyl-CoA reductase-like NAD-dependent aldehyde dehydrogenase
VEIRGKEVGRARYAGVTSPAAYRSLHDPAVTPEPLSAPPHREADGGRVLEVRRPADGSSLGAVPVTAQVEVLQAVERARSLQRQWIELTAEERFRTLAKLAEAVGDNAQAIADVIRSETGKPEVEAMTEVLMVLDLLRYYDEVAPRILRRQWVKTGWLIGKSAYIYREPFGVIGVISAWNYPFLLPMDVVAAALYGGNAVVVKPSEYTPFTALKALDLCRIAGLPEGLLQIVPGDAATGDALAGGGVDKLVFIGSPRSGRKVAVRAAESLTPVALELGGKDAAIVLEDADLDRAANGIVFGGFFNAGQTCLSIERVLVVDQVHDELVAKIAEITKRLRVGTEGEYDVGPMTTPAQLHVVEDQLEDALLRGARVVTGGHRLEDGSNVFMPTVLADVDASMKVMWEETFGPLLPIVRVSNEDEALRLVNVNPFGFAASVWTEDRERGEKLGERIRAGIVSVNDVLSHYAVPGLPVGGSGESGYGRRRGVAGLEEMTRSRSVIIHRTGLSRELWWFPYNKKGLRLVHVLIEARQEKGVRRLWAGLRGFLRRHAR